MRSPPRAEVTVTVLNHGDRCAWYARIRLRSTKARTDITPWTARLRALLRAPTTRTSWTARGSTANTDQLIAGADGPAPTFMVPDRLDATTTYEYLLTVGAENAESASAAVTVTVLNHGALSVVCVDLPYGL